MDNLRKMILFSLGEAASRQHGFGLLNMIHVEIWDMYIWMDLA